MRLVMLVASQNALGFGWQARGEHVCIFTFCNFEEDNTTEPVQFQN